MQPSWRMSPDVWCVECLSSNIIAMSHDTRHSLPPDDNHRKPTRSLCSEDVYCIHNHFCYLTAFRTVFVTLNRSRRISYATMMHPREAGRYY